MSPADVIVVGAGPTGLMLTSCGSGPANSGWRSSRTPRWSPCARNRLILGRSAIRRAAQTLAVRTLVRFGPTRRLMAGRLTGPRHRLSRGGPGSPSVDRTRDEFAAMFAAAGLELVSP